MPDKRVFRTVKTVINAREDEPKPPAAKPVTDTTPDNRLLRTRLIRELGFNSTEEFDLAIAALRGKQQRVAYAAAKYEVLTTVDVPPSAPGILVNAAETERIRNLRNSQDLYEDRRDAANDFIENSDRLVTSPKILL